MIGCGASGLRRATGYVSRRRYRADGPFTRVEDDVVALGAGRQSHADYSAIDGEWGEMPNWGFVWMVAWPDFRTRLTRFMVIGTGMALVMAVTLLLAAFSEGFQLRSERLLSVFDADRYVVASGSSGPMTATTPLPASLVDEIARQSDVDARPLFLIPTAILTGGVPQGVIVVGSNGDEPGFRLTDGRRVGGRGEAVVDEEIVGLVTGDRFVLAGEEFIVVGQSEHATWDIANAGVFIDRQQALDLFAGGRDVVTAIAIDGDGEIGALPDGVEVQTRADGFDDVLNRTAAAKRSIDSFTYTLWALAIVIVGAVLYLAAIERIRDFAIFKATGASNRDLVAGLGLQAAIVGAIAGVLSIGLAHLKKPVYPGLLSLPLRVAWPVIPVAVVIAILSSMVGVRRAIRVDPSQAFG